MVRGDGDNESRVGGRLEGLSDGGLGRVMRLGDISGRRVAKKSLQIGYKRRD